MFTLNLSSNCKFDDKLSELFTEICYKNRKNFNNLIKNLTQGNNFNIDLLVSNPSSRNTLNSKLFIDFCKIQLVIEILNNKRTINKIIIDSKALEIILRQFPELVNTSFTLKRRKIKNSIKNSLYRIINPFIVFFIRFFNLLLFKIIKSKTKIPNYPITLIDTYAFPGYYSKDRYYNGLWQSLNDKEKIYIYFVPTIVMTKWNKMYSAYKDLINSERQFLFKESYLKFSDILFAALYSFRIQFIKIKSLMVNGIDYSTLINEELYSRRGHDLAIEGLINYRFIMRLKENNIKINKIIDWWESQALDKGLHKAINDYYPNVPVVGYLGYAPRNMELQLYPTKFELENGVVPKIIAVMGKGFIDGLKIFNPNQKVDSAPAFRFQHLWNDGPDVTDKATYDILIALPITFYDSVHIIEKMIAYSNEKYIKTMRIWIKPHPTMHVKKLKKYFSGRWPHFFHFIDLQTQEALRKANLLVSGMSSICLEAMALGLPVIVIDRPLGLQYNPIPDDLGQDLWKECSSTQDIIDGIELYKNRDNAELIRHKDLGLQIRETYFEPVTRLGVLKFLSIEGDPTFEKS